MVVKAKVLLADGRAVEVRIRSNRRIAFPAVDLPDPPPKRVVLKCRGEALEAGLTTVQFGFAVYYMPRASWDRLIDLVENYKPHEIWRELMPNALPCILHY